MNPDARCTDLYPMRFAPVYRDYIWGGQRIIAAYRRAAPPGIYAESWELSSRADGMSVAANGCWAGQPLSAILSALGPGLLGARDPASRPGFPLLIKLIDSRERLSVQVHPDDEAAARFGGEAKTEMWYVLEAAPGARVFAGLRPGTDRKVFEAAIRGGDIESVLQAVPVAPGDAIFVPGGRVHAIDAGCLLLEVQQNSDTTYRIYDWGRVGHDGRPRQTHLAQALRTIRWGDAGGVKIPSKPLPATAPNAREDVLSCRHFQMERWTLRAPAALAPDGDSFIAIFIARGAVTATWAGGQEIHGPGTTVLVPAALPSLDLRPVEADATLLLIRRGAARLADAPSMTDASA